MIQYQNESSVSVDEYIELLIKSTLGARRPVDEPDRMARMIANTDILITARAGELLVGVARSISDFAYCTYLSDLAVDVQYQKQGIGKQLIEQTRIAAGDRSSLILLSAPQAVDYYPHVGFHQHNSCWILPAKRT